MRRAETLFYLVVGYFSFIFCFTNFTYLLQRSNKETGLIYFRLIVFVSSLFI